MKNYKLWQTLTCIGAAALLFACVLSFFAPFPRTVLRSERSVYECAWENGGKSQETYSSAFAALSHFDGETTVIERGGVTGYIAADEESCMKGNLTIFYRSIFRRSIGCTAPRWREPMRKRFGMPTGNILLGTGTESSGPTVTGQACCRCFRASRSKAKSNARARVSSNYTATVD